MVTTSTATKLLLARALELENLYRAWEEVRSNRGAEGGDQVTLARFERRLELNLLHLAERVQTGTYQPGKVRVVTIQTGQKRREIAIWCVADRVLQRAVLQVMEPIFEPTFFPSSFGYRPGLSVADAVRRTIQLRDSGYVWVVEQYHQNLSSYQQFTSSLPQHSPTSSRILILHTLSTAFSSNTDLTALLLSLGESRPFWPPSLGFPFLPSGSGTKGL